MKKKINRTVIRIILHILAWSLVLAVPFFSARRISLDIDFLLIFYSFTLINVLIFYSNYLVLVPELFFKRPRYRYYISAVALIFVFYFVSDFTSDKVFGYLQRKNAERAIFSPESKVPGPMPIPRGGLLGIRLPPGNAHLTGYISSSLFMLFLSLGVKVLERQSSIEKLQEKMEREKLNAELALLKNQISPHFFFNTLNNIYSLVSINPEDAQKAIHKLSKLMRYLLYESEHGNTKLSREIEFMTNYIDLMKLRLNEKILFTVEFNLKDDISVPPLLFIPFIENAFKHGISYREKSFISVNLSAGADSVSFRCVNSLVKGSEKDSSYSGIGLENVRKRLALLFPGKHELKIKKSDGEFEVLLKISLA